MRQLAQTGNGKEIGGDEKGIDAEVVKYLDTPPSKEELIEVLKMLGMSARELMRTTEDDYKNWTYTNHHRGLALVTPSKWKTKDGFETVARFCFINPDTTEDDIKIILDTMK